MVLILSLGPLRGLKFLEYADPVLDTGIAHYENFLFPKHLFAWNVLSAITSEHWV